MRSGEWTTVGNECFNLIANVHKACLAQDEMLKGLASKQAQLEAMQTRLNDADFWQGVK
jgi:hypothetical protein